MVRGSQVLFRESYGYWTRYVERQMFQGWRVWKGPLNGWKGMYRKPHQFYFDENRPWTDQFKVNNALGKRNKKYYVEPIKEWTMFKGDMVQLLAGKDEGKQGRIVQIIKERNWCFVEGLNCKYEFAQFDKEAPGQTMKTEMPLLVTTEVSLIDPSDEKPTKVEWRYTEQGQRVRVSTRTGRLIGLPPEAEELEDFVTPSTYKDQTKDTKESAITEITFKPSLKTFEQDIMDEMGLVDDRKPAKTYWW